MSEKTRKAPASETPMNGWLNDPHRTAKSSEFEKAFEEGAEATAAKVGRVVLPALEILPFYAYIVGDSELICHAWSEKAIKQMLDGQVGEATAGREKKDPVADFWGSLYVGKRGKLTGDWRKGGSDSHPAVTVAGGEYHFPAIALKNAMVEACTSVGRSAITKVQARQCFQVIGEQNRILAPVLRMRRDMVKLKNGSPDIRFRGGFPDWSMRIKVRYNARVLSAAQILNLLNTAGFAVGIGEWRSEKDGSYGLFHVASETEHKAIEKKYGRV